MKGMPSDPSLIMSQAYLYHARLMQRPKPLFVHLVTSTQTSMSSQTFTHLLHQLLGYQVYVTLHLEHSNLL